MKENCHVLVVDDDNTIAEMLKTGLEIIGYSVTVAMSETEIWDSLKQKLPDVILMDVGMPGIDGISLCRTLRFSKDYADVPIVTAFSDNRTFHDAMFFGASGFLTKPFDMGDVQKKIEEVLEKNTVR